MTRLLIVVIVLLVAALCVERVLVNRAHAYGVRAAVTLDSIEAARDTTREVRVAALHDSVRVFVRRARQVEQRADALDRALQATRLARLNAQVRIAALDTVVRVERVTVVRDSARRSRFAVRDPPYTVVGDVTRRGGSANDDAEDVSLHVELDSIPLEVRLSCETVRDTPVKRAIVVVAAPVWAGVAVSRVAQSPAVFSQGRCMLHRLFLRIPSSKEHEEIIRGCAIARSTLQSSNVCGYRSDRSWPKRLQRMQGWAWLGAISNATR
jgi:hypothetical protein